MTCGTGALFWRVGRGCKIPLVSRPCRQTTIQDWWGLQMHKSGHKSGHKSVQTPTDRQTDENTNKTGGTLRRQTPVKTYRLKKGKEKFDKFWKYFSGKKNKKNKRRNVEQKKILAGKNVDFDECLSIWMFKMNVLRKNHCQMVFRGGGWGGGGVANPVKKLVFHR